MWGYITKKTLILKYQIKKSTDGIAWDINLDPNMTFEPKIIKS